MSKTTWADVKKGTVVELNGREWLVTKIKKVASNPKKAAVKLERRGHASKGEVRLKDRVTIAAKGDGSKRGPLFDDAGTAQRWASKKELRETLDGASLPAGDPAQTKPPAKAKGSPWDTPADRIEKKLDAILGARLVGVATDEDAGYYVPRVDSSTVAAHLALFHGGIPEACDDDERKMLKAHDAQHAAALKGEGVLEVNHWHTEKRPDA